MEDEKLPEISQEIIPENDQEVIGEIEEKEWTTIIEQVDTLQEATNRLMDKIVEIEERLEKPVDTATEATQNNAEDLASEVEQAEELTMTAPEKPPISQTRSKNKPVTKKINLFRRA